MTPPLPGVFAAFAPVLDHYGYLAVAVLLFLEDFGVPAPGETVLIAAAVYAGAGRLSLPAVILVGVLAAIAGDNVGYAIGRFGGRRLVERYGRYVGLTAPRVEAAERFFVRHGGKVIVVARFVEGLRQANGIIAGLSGMRWTRFLAFNVLGAVLWVGLWTTLGDLAGSHIDAIYTTVRRYEPWFLGALAALAVAAIVRRVHRKRVQGPAAGSAAGDGGTATSAAEAASDHSTEEPRGTGLPADDA